MKNIIVISAILLIASHANAQTNFKNTDSESEKYIDSLLSMMTLTEKVHLLTGDHLYSFPGVARVNITAFFPSDGLSSP